MAADLKTSGVLLRSSYYIQPDCLVKLEHGTAKDRVRKVGFDRVEQVIVWRQIPVVRLVIAVLFLILGLLLFLPGEPVIFVFAGIICAIAGGSILWYLYCQKTTIRLVRAGREEDVRGIFSPGKVRRAVIRLRENIEATQARGFQQLEEKRAALEAALIPTPPAAEPSPASPPPLPLSPDATSLNRPPEDRSLGV